MSTGGEGGLKGYLSPVEIYKKGTPSPLKFGQQNFLGEFKIFKEKCKIWGEKTHF